MTGQPPDRPDFVPPEGQTSWSDGRPPDPAPALPAEPPPPPGGWQAAPQEWEPPPPPPLPPPPPVQHQDVLPPGPYKQPWVPPRSRRARREPGHGSILLGMLISLAAVGLSFMTLGAAVFIVAIGLFVVGIVLSAMPKTTRTGAGLLIGLGASVLVAAGICIALIASYPV